MPLQRVVPLRGTLSCAFGAALLQGPTHQGLSHIGFLQPIGSYLALLSCSPVPDDMRLLSDAFALGEVPIRWGLSHMGFYAVTTNCASLRHSILRLWRGPSPRAYSFGVSHIGFHTAGRIVSCSVVMLTRFPTICDYRQTRSPLEKGLLVGTISHGLSYRRRLTICLLF